MAIQNRQGDFKDFDPNKLLPGEWAVVKTGDSSSKDGTSVYMCFSAGNVKKMATYEDMKQNIDSATKDIQHEFYGDVEKMLQEAEGALSALKEEIESAQTVISNTENAANSANLSSDKAIKSAENAEKMAESAKTAADLAINAKESIEEAVKSGDFSPTFEVGSVETVDHSSDASVKNVGTNKDIVLNFQIPKADPTARISVGNVTTGLPGSDATVTNEGTDKNVVLNFQIPRGEPADFSKLSEQEIQYESKSYDDSLVDEGGSINIPETEDFTSPQVLKNFLTELVAKIMLQKRVNAIFSERISPLFLKQGEISIDGTKILYAKYGRMCQLYVSAMKMSKIPDCPSWNEIAILAIPEELNFLYPAVEIPTKVICDGNSVVISQNWRHGEWAQSFFASLKPDGKIYIHTRAGGIYDWDTLGDGNALWLGFTYIGKE